MNLDALVQLIVEYRYWILFPLACIEGPMVGFVAGVLVALGYFNPLLTLGVLVLADVLPDSAYYWFGRLGKQRDMVARYGHKIGITPERFDMVRGLWFNHTFKTMAITKFAYGLSTPLLITAGLVHLPFRWFWQSSVPLGVAQYAVLMALGFFFGGSFALVESGLVKAQMAIAGAVVLFVVYFVVTRAVSKNFLAHKEEMASE